MPRWVVLALRGVIAVALCGSLVVPAVVAWAGSLLVLALAVVARVANRTTPGDEVAPGLVGLVCGAALIAAGMAMVVHVMRVLPAQAVRRDAEARRLQAELDQVV